MAKAKAYSLLSLTAIRILPSVLALTGGGELVESKLFLAWFGPRGLASIVFFVIVANEGLRCITESKARFTLTIMSAGDRVKGHKLV